MTNSEAAPTATNPLTDPALRTLAVATDTRLADLDQERARLEARLAARVATVRDILGHRSRQVSRTRQEWPTTVNEAIAELTAKLAADTLKPWDAARARAALAGIVEARAALLVNAAQTDRLHTVWADNGCWSRFFLVQASNGHVHYDISGDRCSRTMTTDHGWIPELSGLTEADAVAKLGPRLCTSCFPTAPVEWTIGKPKAARCPGAGKSAKPATSRRVGMKTYGECTECGERQIVTTSGIRAHKPKA